MTDPQQALKQLFWISDNTLHMTAKEFKDGHWSETIKRMQKIIAEGEL